MADDLAEREDRSQSPAQSSPIAKPHHPTAASPSTPLLPFPKRQARTSSNAFDESFSQALKRTKPALQPDSPSETEDTARLAIHTIKPLRTISLVGKHILLSAKTNPSLGICVWHEFSHSSQYTRPVVEILREVLDVRYPVPAVLEVGGDV